MNDPWIPVVGDAVKIGLGAFIGGLFAIIAQIVSSRGKRSEERAKQTRELLLTISVEFERLFARAAKRHMESAALAAAAKKKSSEAAAELAKRLRESSDDLIESHHALHALEARLHVIGLRKSTLLMQEYRHAFGEFLSAEAIVPVADGEEPRAAAFRRMSEARIDIYHELMVAYEKA